MCIAIIALAIYVAVQDIALYGNPPLKLWNDLEWTPKLLIAVGIAGGALVLIAHGAKAALHGLLLALFVAAFYVILTLPYTVGEISKGQTSAESHRTFIIGFTFGLLPSQVVFGLNFASPRFLNYRFVLILMTVATILALSYLSRILAQLTPP